MEDAKNALTTGGRRGADKGRQGVRHEGEAQPQPVRARRSEKRRAKGRSRGQGRGEAPQRQGRDMDHKKSMRAQRRVLKALKDERNDRQRAVQEASTRWCSGGTFDSKVSLLSRIRSAGVRIADEKAEKLRHI